MKVLLVVDMQKGFINKPHYKKVNKKIDKLLKNSNYDKIILTRFVNDKSKNPLYVTQVGWNKLTTAAEQEFSVTVPSDAVILEKYGYGLQLEDLEYIKSLNVNSIDVCGVKANACVYAIALQLFDLGIAPNILINYVECNPSTKDVMKLIFEKQFGQVDNKM